MKDERNNDRKWITDAGFMDVEKIPELIYTNGIIDSFLKGDKLFLSANKGMGKTLVMKYKRLQVQRDNPSAFVIPQNKPYLDNMDSARVLGPNTEFIVTTEKNAVSIWTFAINISIISHLAIQLKQDDLKIFQDPPFLIFSRYLKHPEPTKINPTEVFNMFLGLSPSEIAKILKSVGILNRTCRLVNQEVRIFIDKVDQGLLKLSENMWTCVQGALLEAAYNIYNANPHIKVYGTIRQEALSNYRSEIKSNLRSAVANLYYSRRELTAVTERLMTYYEGSSLRDFFGAGKTIKTALRIEETIFDFILRHSLQRPRDIVSIFSTISTMDRKTDPSTLRDAVVHVANDEIVPSIIDESEIFLDLLKDEKKRKKLLITLKYNVLSEEETRDVFAEYNEVPKDVLGQLGLNDKSYYHPFSELYKIGLLGFVNEDSKIKFKMPDDYQDFQSTKLPASDYYIIHPAFSRYILAHGNEQYKAYRFILPGHNLPWNRELNNLLIPLQRRIFKIQNQVLEDKFMEYIETNFSYIEQNLTLPINPDLDQLISKIDELMYKSREGSAARENAADLFIFLNDVRKEQNQLLNLKKIFDPVGEWAMIEQYDYGRTSGILTIIKDNGRYAGTIIVSDIMDGGIRFKVEEKLEVQVNGNCITLKGTESKVIENGLKVDIQYYLDKWEGEFRDRDTIVGTSMDENSTVGHFTCQRKR